ncbi:MULTISPECIES: spore coat protein [Psychrobacillus]|uniref:Spore coat protein n=1 Tax=Psychrobacillus lasiicapitis TaxID=1636719 RepID=A0A544TH12_9BACI|nr:MULTISPECIES: spore coat protein [Psychrobacillus]MDI2588886.1 spore coat protein [Psychrobacillus sp. NEAU-3TGS]TQR16718.1 spore coat protein [Psychrobacillus lasiicapitis]GGA27822.1 spore coat protein X [Psychrobacillus lasiicapitis]
MSKSKWRALDHCDDKGKNNDADVQQNGEQIVTTKQQSKEWIIVRDSEGVDIQTTDTQAALSLQLGIQAAIAAVISLTIGDTAQGRAVTQDMKQFVKTKQQNVQKTIVEGSRNISVTTTDTDVAVNIQAMLQILVTLVAKLDIL